MVDPSHTELVRRPDIKVTNRLHYVAVFYFGPSEIRVHPHALERFLERQDVVAHAYAGKLLESPEEALLTLKDMMDAGSVLEVSPEKRRRRREKYKVPATYLGEGPWRFIIHERPGNRTLRTCYRVSEEEVQQP